MNPKTKNWLVIGVKKNWITALSQPVPIWGLKPRYQAEFQALDIGDLVWFYITSPVKGIIGVGAVKDKYMDPMNLIWEEELKNKEVIWPLRFRIHVLKVIPEDFWNDKKIDIRDFRLNWQIGFQLFQEQHVILLNQRSEQLFGKINKEDLFIGATITNPIILREPVKNYTVEEGISKPTHRELQEIIAEIGKLQFYHSELEYPIDLPGEDKNLDVVWKREISGVPTFAFEIELSGAIERAIVRLKFAFQGWNSRPRIVVPKNFQRKVNNIVSGEQKEFAREIKLYEPNQIIELIRKKRELKSFEQNLGIY